MFPDPQLQSRGHDVQTVKNFVLRECIAINNVSVLISNMRQRIFEYQVVLCKIGFGACLLDAIDDKLGAVAKDLKAALRSLSELPLLVDEMDPDWERCKFIVYGDIEQFVERAVRMGSDIGGVEKAMESLIKARNKRDFVMPDDVFDENRYLTDVNARRLEDEFIGKVSLFPEFAPFDRTRWLGQTTYCDKQQDEGILPAWRRPRRNALSILEY
ncbi:hypothetical protein F5Y18DRAFT_119325 [Xylariaceae sp. FL1019]|nr:hypothetical protein F5Y18DRAFT_119325 [Xylariaceae sp. FL1019]